MPGPGAAAATFFVCCFVLPSVLAGTFDVRDFGGIGDGRTSNTAAFAKAVGAAHAEWVSRGAPADDPSYVTCDDGGVFVSGQIALLSGVYLSVSPLSVLLASNDSAEYPADPNEWGFVFAHNAATIGLVGGGVVDGNWTAYVRAWDPVNIEWIAQGWPGCAGHTTNDCRPMLAKFFNATDIVIDRITLQGSPFWTLHLWNCSRVVVSQLTQWGDARFPNNDGYRWWWWWWGSAFRFFLVWLGLLTNLPWHCGPCETGLTSTARNTSCWKIAPLTLPTMAFASRARWACRTHSMSLCVRSACAAAARR